MNYNYDNLPIYRSQGEVIEERLVTLAGEGDDGGKKEGGEEGGEGGKKVEFDLAKVLQDPNAKKTLEAWAEREVAAPLKSKNQELLGKLTKYKVKNEKGEEVYISPDEAISAIDKVKKGLAPDVQEEINRAVKEAIDRKQVEVDAYKNERDGLSKRVQEESTRRHKLLMDNELRGALVASGIKSGKLPLHENYLRNFVQVVEEGGREMVIVMDDTGKPRYGSGGLMSIAEFVAEYRNRDGIAEDWAPTVKSGSGTVAGGGGRGIPAIDPKLAPSERLKILRRQK